MQEGARVDAEGGDTTLGMRRSVEEQLTLISIPKQYGGLSDGSIISDAEALFEIQTNLSACDSSLGQNFGTNQLVAREIFHYGHALPASTLRKIADEFLSGRRFVASNAGTGVTAQVKAREVPGGLRISGVKSFNTNSGGGGYAFVGFQREGFEGGRYHAIIPLDDPGVRMHGDWDNMGQRGTFSQTITYDDVFVPDGWHFHAPYIDACHLSLVFLNHSVLMLGCAIGAFDVGLEHLRSTNRVLLGQFKSSVEDPLMMRRVGAFSAKLRAARVLQRHVARELQNATTEELAKESAIDALRTKVVCLESALEITQGLFDLTGARTTANKYRFDRFWRNARTFASHDPLDVLQVWIGGWELEQREPNILAQVRFLHGTK